MQPEAKKVAAEESGDLSLRRGGRFHLKKPNQEDFNQKNSRHMVQDLCSQNAVLYSSFVTKMPYVVSLLQRYKLGLFCMIRYDMRPASQSLIMTNSSLGWHLQP